MRRCPMILPTAAIASSAADWTQFHQDNMQRWNTNETALGVNNVDSLQVKWTKPINNSRGFQASPVVANGVVYSGSDDGNIYALNASTGATLWSFAAGDAVRESPAEANGVVYATTFGNGNNVYALDAGTGALRWRFTASTVVFSAPTVVNGVVYFGALQAVYALNASTGALLWSHPEIEVSSSPAVANGVVYVTMSGDTNADALD